MKYVKTFESFIYENENTDKNEVKLDQIRKKLEGQEGERTVLSMYNFYINKGYSEIKDPRKLLSKLEYYDQTIRKENIFKMSKSIGLDPRVVDKINAELIKPFIGRVKPGTDEFSPVWIIVQHADHDVALQKKFIEIHGDSIKGDEKLAFLKDRVSTNEGEPQQGISQGMPVTMGGKTGWVPYQTADIEFEKEEFKARQEDTNKDVILLKWKEGETSKVTAAVKATIGENGVKQAEQMGLEINLKNYVIHRMKTDYLGPYMIKP
jgi:hypothetical protein